MSLEKILIIKRYPNADFANCKVGLETSPERYSVLIANDYSEGQFLLKTPVVMENERVRLVIVDADEVDTYTLELLTNIRISNYNLPVIVLTNLAGNGTRHSLTLTSSECIVKTGDYDKFLWHMVKKSLERNSNRQNRSTIRPKKAFHPFSVGKKGI
ncbi:MAG: hypothetical protein AB1489_28175 [Acidobacteriota bacterium]